MTIPVDIKLTSEEDAYAHLASFQLGDDVIVTDPHGRRSGVVRTPQRGNLADAYLTVRLDGSGDVVWVDIARLLSGQWRITADAPSET